MMLFGKLFFFNSNSRTDCAGNFACIIYAMSCTHSSGIDCGILPPFLLPIINCLLPGEHGHVCAKFILAMYLFPVSLFCKKLMKTPQPHFILAESFRIPFNFKDFFTSFFPYRWQTILRKVYFLFGPRFSSFVVLVQQKPASAAYRFAKFKPFWKDLNVCLR